MEDGLKKKLEVSDWPATDYFEGRTHLHKKGKHPVHDRKVIPLLD